MIDWISAVVPCAHLTEIQDGCFMKADAKGEIQWTSPQRLKVTGSHDARVQIRSAQWMGDCTHIEISGNLTKFFQGHNLWGTDDLPGLVLEFMLFLCTPPENPLSLLPSAEDVHAWRTGAYSLQRVDVTDSYTLRGRSDVLAWLRAAEQTAHLAHRGRGQLCKGSTLYFGKNSRRWSLKLYSKGQEIDAHSSEQLAIVDLPHARAWADNVLRTELVIRSMELKRIGLSEGTAWLPLDGVPFESLPMLRNKLGAMTMTTNRTLSEEVIATLTAGQHSGYLAWVSGNDLRDVMSRPSFYRLRSKLLPHGVDIATLQPSEDRSNVVPLVRVLEAIPASIPEWAKGTALYFEPRRVA